MCGKQVSDNYLEIHDGAVANLMQRLDAAAMKAASNQETLQEKCLLPFKMVLSRITSNPRSILLRQQFSSQASDQERPVPVTITEDSTSIPPRDENRDILLCTTQSRPKRLRTHMDPVNAREVVNDRQLLRKLTLAYRKRIGLLRIWFGFKCLRQIHFVRVSP